MTQFVWHYAPWAYLPRIVEAGELRPGNAAAEAEVPMLWFSAHPFWEPTATKGIASSTGAMRAMTFREQVERVGCIRFGLLAADARLIEWKRACVVAGTPRETRRAMERVGRKKGANPLHWFACAVAIALPELTFQVLLEGAWRDTTGAADMAKVWTDTRGAGK